MSLPTIPFTPKITPFSGPNDVDYTATFFENASPPFLSLRPVSDQTKLLYYNLGFATKPTEFTFNPSITPLNYKQNPVDAPIPPIPGVYKLVINKGTGGVLADTVLATFNLQNDTMFPTQGFFSTSFYYLYKKKDSLINFSKIYAIFNGITKIGITDSTRGENPYNFSFKPSQNAMVELGNYELYAATSDDKSVKSLGSITIIDQLGLARTLSIDNDARDQAILGVTELTTSGLATLGGITVPETGLVNLNGGLTVALGKLSSLKGGVTTSTITASGITTLNDALTATTITASGITTLNGGLIVKGLTQEFKNTDISVKKTFDISSGNIKMLDYSDSSAPNTATTTLGSTIITSTTTPNTGRLYVEAAEFNCRSNLVVNNTSTLKGGLSVTGNSTLNGGLSVTGNSTVTGSLIAPGLTTNGNVYTTVKSAEAATARGASAGNIGKIYKKNLTSEITLSNGNYSILKISSVPKGVYIIDIYLHFYNPNGSNTLGFGSNAHLTLADSSTIYYDYDMSNNNNLAIGKYSYDCWRFNPVLVLPNDDSNIYLNLNVAAYVGASPRLNKDSFISATRIS